MSLLPANTQENLDFKFIELRKVKVADKINTNVINNVAISSNHQVVFVAFANSIKVIRISTLLDFEWSKDIINRTIDSYPCIEIQLPFTPSLLSVSGGTNSLLFVFGQNHMNCLSGDIYNIPSILENNLNPVNQIDLPPAIIKNVHIQSVAWHPEFSETLFAAILSNGALITVGIDHQTKGLLVQSHYTDSFKLTCVSWSPKGKQLVTGGDNGQLTQFKHQNGKNFQKAKIIQPPKDLESHGVISINWVHSALFQVGYVNNASPNNPDTRVVFVHAPPKAQPEYYDFGSICMETSPYTGSDNYRVTFAEIGNILLCLSSNSSEVSVIGCETGDICPTPNLWSQWILEDTARIELQPDDNKAESSPCGVAWFKGPTKVFKVSENSTIGGQNYPLVLILASSGILYPYYAHHSQGKLTIPDPLTSQPLPISVPPPAPINRQNISANQQTVSQTPLTKSSSQSFSTSTPAVEASFTFPLPKNQEKPKTQTTLSTSATIQAPSKLSQNQTSTVQQQQQQQLQQQQLQQLQQQQLQQMQQMHQQQLQQQHQQHQQQQQQQQQQRQQQQQQQNKPSQPAISEEELRKKEQEVMEETFALAIKEEIAEFSKTLQSSKDNFAKTLNLQIGKPDELCKLQTETVFLTEVLQVSAETLKTIDINMLNGFLLETWAMVQEATTRLERETDPIYTLLVNKRSLDPITARKMREIKKLAHNIEMQLEDFNKILDREWEEYTAKLGSKRPSYDLSSIDMIYHTLSTHHKTIEYFKKRLRKFEQNMAFEDINEDNIVSPRRKEIQEMIESLRNASIQDDMIFTEIIPQTKSVLKVPTISKEKKEKLLEFFEQRNSVPVRRAILPVDLKSSKMVSAVVKAKERLKEIRAKAQIFQSPSPVKSDVGRTTLEQTKTQSYASQTPVQTTPVRGSDKKVDLDQDQDKSLFYSTAIGDMSRCVFNTQSPSQTTISHLSPIINKNETQVISKALDKTLSKEADTTNNHSKPLSFSNNTTVKTEPKDDSKFSFSFGPATSVAASNTNLSSNFSNSSVFQTTNKIIEADKSSMSSFSTALTKENSKNQELSAELTSKNLENKKDKSVPSAIGATDAILSNAFSKSNQIVKQNEASSTFNFSSQSGPSPSVTTVSSTSINTSSSTISTTTTRTSTVTAPFSFSSAPNTGFSFASSSSTTTTTISNPPNLTTTTTTDTKATAIPAFSAKPVQTAASTFSFGGSFKLQTTAPSTGTTTSTSATVASGSASSTTTSTVISTASTSSPTVTKPFGFNLLPNSNVLSSVSLESSVTSPPATPPIFSLSTKSELIPTTSSVSTALSSPLNLSVGPPIFSSPTSSVSSSAPSFPVTNPAPVTSSTASTTVGVSTSFGTVSSNPQPSPSITSSSPSLFGGAANTTAFFTPTSSAFSFSQQADSTTSKTSETPTSAPAFNFNAALQSLGNQPSQDNASKNPFGAAVVNPTPQLSLFSSKTTTAQTSTFGSPPSLSSSFASGGAGVAQTGFGAFQTQNQPRFGAQPTFGGAPTFGSQPTFGGSPTFGAAVSFGKSMSNTALGFGQASAPAPTPAQSAPTTQQQSPFASFANTNAPSFGALASQQTPTFGQLAAATQPVQQPSSTPFGGFGQTNSPPSIFGNAFPTAPAFGSPQFSQRRQ